ncbi:hypothetical protein V6N13_094800 [Hibiscus sabdariffa]
MGSIAEKIFERYSSNTVNLNAKGISLIWFRNDLRYHFPRLFQIIYNYGFPKTGSITFLPAFWIAVSSFPFSRFRCMLIKKPAPRSYKLKDWWHQSCYFQSVGAKCAIRNCIKLAKSLGPPPSIDDWGIIPSIEQLGLESEKAR